MRAIIAALLHGIDSARANIGARKLVGVAAFMLACLCLAALQGAGAFRPLNSAFATARAQMVQRAPSNSIVVVAIDTPSLRADQQWPWPRERFAQAVRNLHAAGANLIVFDVDFSARSSTSSDSAFASAIDAADSTIVLPSFVQGNAGQLDENQPLAMLSANAIVGSVNIPVDVDGVARRYQRGFTIDGAYRGSIASIMAGAPYGDTSSFLIDYGVRAADIDRISFVDVLRNEFDPARVRGKNVLIGATALELGDEFATPVAPMTPGVLIHALAYESLAQDRTLIGLGNGAQIALGFVILAALWPQRRTTKLAIILHFAVLAVWAVLPFILQMAAPVSFDVGALIAAQALAGAASIQRELTRRSEEILRQREAHLAHIATHDPETQLPNRRALLQDLQERIAATNDAIAVAAVGIDRFPILRGAIGYAGANELMLNLSQRIAERCRGRAYHLSPSTLGVVFSAPTEAGIHAFCSENILHQIQRVTVQGQDIEVSIRIGMALSTQCDGGPAQMLEHASLALDQARLNNRHHVVHETAHSVDPQVQLTLMSELRTGLERGEFSLLYQPKSTAADGAIVGAESLMRWRHPRLGDVSPDQFITLAEELGVIEPITRWALERAISDQAKMRAHGLDIPLSVNLSGRCLTDADFCNFAIAAVRDAQAEICFEITETAVIDDPLAAMEWVAALREAGIRISIDDYGAGYSSLTYLKRLAAHELKVDKSLVTDIQTNARDRLILSSTINLAHSLGMTVVAEGVEDAATMAVLASMNCDCVQGYWTGRPMPLDALIAAAAFQHEVAVVARA